MAFRQTRFLGASVSSFSANVGWNEQSGSLTVTLVEDKSNKTTKYIWANHTNGYVPTVHNSPTTSTTPDYFQELAVGSAVHFRVEDFVFNGILQSWEKKRSVSGGEYYEVVINSPTEIIGNVELIIGGYSGTVGIANLMNIYGYYESLSYGSSQVNEAGMPWSVLSTGLVTLTQLLGSYSGGIVYKGVRYLLDLSQLPFAPQYYRVQGNSVNLLQVISQLCQDAGFDFFVKLYYLNGLAYISFKTVDRGLQPDLTALRTFIANRTDAGQKNSGVELRNETTSAFVVGGPMERLWRMTGDMTPDTIWPYWGLDASGNAIIGEGTNDSHTFILDTRSVDCTGVEDTYTCTVGEIRAALAGMDSWVAYIAMTDEDKATALNIPNYFDLDNDEMKSLFTGGDVIPLNSGNMSDSMSNFLNDDAAQEEIFRLFNFIQNIANEFYGIKFLVSVGDLINVKREPDTERVVTSYEPSDGGYLEFSEWSSGAQPLDLPPLFKDIFTLEDGRYVTFVKFDDYSLYELKDLAPDSFVVKDDGSLYLKCSVESYIVYADAENFTNPYVVINLPSPVVLRVEDSTLWGQASLLVKALIKADGGDPVNDTPTAGQINKVKQICKENANNLGGHFPVDFGHFANIPSQVCVPLRSNTLTYGPWFVIGPEGKVRFEQDSDLVPWNFNGYTYMNQAANAKIIDVIAGQQAGEMGSVELVGAPIIQLGDALVNGGPNVTGIDVSYSTGGVTTNYRMRTFTPSFGGFAKYNADRLQRLARTSRDNERKFLSNLQTSAKYQQISVNKHRKTLAKDGLSGNLHKSPHSFLAMTYSNTPFGSGTKYNVSATMTKEELLSGINTNYGTTAAISLDALFRPFSTDPMSSGLPKLENCFPALSGYKHSQHFNSFNYHTSIISNQNSTIKSPDIMIATFGDTNTGLQTNLEDNRERDDARLIGFKGPMIITGWGYDLFGKPVPNSNTTDSTFPTLNSNNFHAEFKLHPENWKSGPLNVRWNPFIKMWDTPNKLIMCTYNGVNANTATYNNITLPLGQFLSMQLVPSGTPIIAGFIEDTLYPLIAGCA